MSNSFGVLGAIVAAWLAIGVVLSIIMGRRGHNSFAWFTLGVLLGPVGVVLAVDAGRHEERQRLIQTGGVAVKAGVGPVDVLVGYDGSPESVAAIDAVVDLIGETLGRLTVATVVPVGDIREADRLAIEGLRSLARRTPGREPEFQVVHGHPSSALRQCAIDGGYELIAVGARGAGITKTILGSAATELACGNDVPVLVVGATTRRTDVLRGNAVRDNEADLPDHRHRPRTQLLPAAPISLDGLTVASESLKLKV